MGVPLIELVNLGRLMGLVVVGAYVPFWFKEAHVFVAQGVMVCMVAALWFWWIERYASRSAP